MLDRLKQAGRSDERVDLGTMVGTVGRRTFAPLLLLPGLIALSPLSGIPGVPSLTALMVLLIAGQLLFGRDTFWLPRWLLNRTVSRTKYEATLKWLRRPARFIDRLLRPRLTILTRGAAQYGTAILCAIVALTMPVMEILPFAATSAGAAFTAFALSLLAHDGLLALIAMTVTSATLILMFNSLFL